MRGSKKQRAKGTWTLYAYTGDRTKSGSKKYRTKTVRGNKRQAETELARFVHQVEAGMDFSGAQLTVGAYLDKWLVVKRAKLQPRTHARYEELIRLHVKPVVGHVALAKLRPLHIEKAYAAGRAKGLSETTLLQVHRVLNGALRQAVRWQYVPRNVVDSVAAPRAERRAREALVPDNVSTVLGAVAGTDLEVPAIIGIGTGMRLGEVLGLRWRDVDIEVGVARVTQTLQLDGSVDTPKSHRSSRAVSLPSFVVEALRGHRKAQNERRLLCGPGWQDLDLVVDRGDGAPPRLDTTSKRFARVMRDAGLELTFHGL